MTRAEALKIAKPILFNTEMARAIQDNRKTQTRRAIKPHNAIKASREGYRQGEGLLIEYSIEDKTLYIKDYSVSPCWFRMSDYIRQYAPYQSGDILYVRETWYYDEHMSEMTAGKPDLPSGRYLHRYICKADNPDYPVHVGVGKHGWRPSIHMPKEAARIFLRVTDIRAERVQGIGGIEAAEEGCKGFTRFNPMSGMSETVLNFKSIWNSTIKKTDLPIYGWGANPWVWVYSFERMEVTP